jgi:hypothetical protein
LHRNLIASPMQPRIVAGQETDAYRRIEGKIAEYQGRRPPGGERCIWRIADMLLRLWGHMLISLQGLVYSCSIDASAIGGRFGYGSRERSKPDRQPGGELN